MAFQDIIVEEGKALPLGATPQAEGVNFAILSRSATAISLILFESSAPESAFQEIVLDSRRNRTGDIWHCRVRGKGIGPGTLYLYRVDGPWKPERGLRFNRNKLLLDPYAKELCGLEDWDVRTSLPYKEGAEAGDLSFSTESDSATKPRCVVVSDEFDWQDDKPLNYPLRFSVLYETHIRGLTMGDSSAVAHPGTYRGVIEKIPFFVDLGITSLEFLPLHEFNEREVMKTNPRTGEKLSQYWGYSTLAFFAPKASYASDRTPLSPVREFKEMVRELHKAGIEIILDVVFNHTAEGNEWGPSISFRGLDNPIYYMLNENRRYYQNYSGCGNTVNCNHPIVRNLIMDCLHYWVIEMHVDGFRFDLGSILGRDQNGALMEYPPMLEKIAEDPVMRNTKLIAEAWDAGGAYQVGAFPGGRWAEWNDRYRDEVRRFWRGDELQARNLATRLSGSSDLYLRDGRKPFHSINFITSHDGFTLRDLVAYNGKHNEENGEHNMDGRNENYSFNYGYEGDTKNPAIETLRNRQIKNFFATLMVSQGTPMILGGDEFGRTQRGNNNAYCQDNAISWYDWRLVEKNAELLRFVREIIIFRRRHPAFQRPEFYSGRQAAYNAIPDISWYDKDGKSPDWKTIDKCLAACMIGTKAGILADRDDNNFFIMFNSSEKPVTFVVCPAGKNKSWFRKVDTALPSPEDILPLGGEAQIDIQTRYQVKPRSLVILLSK